MKAVIIEDERLTAERLHDLIKDNFTQIDVIATLRSVEESIKWLTTNPHPDLIFMDIELGDGSAFDILDQHVCQSRIIFTTAYNEYAIKAFKYNSVDYLLKPIDKKGLNNAIEKISVLSPEKDEVMMMMNELKRYFKQEYKSRFLVRTGQQMLSILTDDIAYLYSEEGYTFIKLKDEKKYIIDNSLDEIIQQLNPKSFFKLNRKFICSITSIKSIVPYFNGRLKVELSPTNADAIVVSRERVKAFKFWLDY